jgi:alpha-beta hydrolase superfamily lysophospholipase
MHAAEGQPEVGVLICPPFGWDDVCSYRSRREWAIHLAGCGRPALRFDLPGAGNSAGGPRDPGRLGAWVEATACAAEWLRAETKGARVAAVGIGLGGLVAALALSDGAPIDDLVLWATPARGRGLVRELRAFSSLEAKGMSARVARRGSMQLARPEQDADSGALEAGGFLMSAETLAALAGVDLRRLPIPRAGGRRALLVQRDGLAADRSLREHLEEAGVDVAEASPPGYAAMMALPHEAVAPTAVFAAVDEWLERGAGRDANGQADRPDHAEASLHPSRDESAAPMEIGGAALRERPLLLGADQERLFTLLAEPAGEGAGDLCMVLFNAGAIYNIGPNRMWVEAARRWAAAGVSVARVDLAALGDSDGDRGTSTDLAALYASARLDEVASVLDALQAQGAGSRFILGGLCSGAYWSFHAAVRDPRVAGVVLLNPRALYWTPDLDRMRELRAGLHGTKIWRRVARGEASPRRVLALLRWLPKLPLLAVRRIVGGRRGAQHGGGELERALDTLRERGKLVQLAFSAEEPLQEELEREGLLGRIGRWPNVALASLPGSDHTLHTVEAQRAAHEVIDRAVERTRGADQSQPAQAPAVSGTRELRGR